jgi:hypothetical protein
MFEYEQLCAKDVARAEAASAERQAALLLLARQCEADERALAWLRARHADAARSILEQCLAIARHMEQTLDGGAATNAAVDDGGP